MVKTKRLFQSWARRVCSDERFEAEVHGRTASTVRAVFIVGIDCATVAFAGMSDHTVALAAVVTTPIRVIIGSRTIVAGVVFASTIVFAGLNIIISRAIVRAWVTRFQ